MTSQFSFLADLTVALAAASIGGFIAARLRLNPILGYLGAGVIIGPFTPGYVARGDTLENLATLGLIFLLFSLGLGFSLGEIRAVGARALAGNLAVMALVAAAAGLAAAAIRFPHPITIALTAAVSSTAVGVAILRSLGAAGSAAGRFAVAQLVVQDLVSVALLVVTTVPADRLTPAEVALPVLKAVAFVVVALVVGATVLHRLVRHIVARAAPETMFVAFAALALVAAWLGYFAGLSFEFGAFVAGAVISEAAGSRTIESVVAPFRALFVTLFFVSIGMLLDPAAFARAWLPIVLAGFALVVLRAALWTLLARLARLPAVEALTVGIAMTALGEFNVVLVNEATAARRLVGEEQQFLLGVAFLSMLVTIAAAPLFSRWSARLARPHPVR